MSDEKKEYRFPIVRTSSLDDIYESNQKALSKLEGSDLTEVDAENIKDLTEWVNQQEEQFRDVQEELLTYLESKGCPVWDYLPKVIKS